LYHENVVTVNSNTLVEPTRVAVPVLSHTPVASSKRHTGNVASPGSGSTGNLIVAPTPGSSVTPLGKLTFIKPNVSIGSINPLSSPIK